MDRLFCIYFVIALNSINYFFAPINDDCFLFFFSLHFISGKCLPLPLVLIMFVFKAPLIKGIKVNNIHSM